MYDEKIEELINAALADGKLTKKEKQVLFKKAEEEEIDLDEFEMILDARLVELGKQQKSAPRSEKLGDVRKCPACGAIIGAFQTSCPECGYEFSNIGPNQYVQNLINAIEKKYKELHKESQENPRSALTYYSDMFHKTNNRDREDAEREVIKNYPLPIAKDDCIEALHFIQPKIAINNNLSHRTLLWRDLYFAILDKTEAENKNDQTIQNIVAKCRKEYKNDFLTRTGIQIRVHFKTTPIWKIVIRILLLLLLILIIKKPIGNLIDNIQNNRDEKAIQRCEVGISKALQNGDIDKAAKLYTELSVDVRFDQEYGLKQGWYNIAQAYLDKGQIEKIPTARYYEELEQEQINEYYIRQKEFDKVDLFGGRTFDEGSAVKVVTAMCKMGIKKKLNSILNNGNLESLDTTLIKKKVTILSKV